MNKTGITLAVIVVIAVLYFIITKADTALSKGESALKQQVVTEEEQTQDSMDDAGLR
jgi:hypothetical protein